MAAKGLIAHFEKSPGIITEAFDICLNPWQNTTVGPVGQPSIMGRTMSSRRSRAPRDRPGTGELPIGALALIAASVLIVITVAAAFLLSRSRRPHTLPPEPTASVTLRAPRGEVKSAPQSFEWEAVPGASQYRVTISDADALWPLFMRTTTSTSLQLDSR